MDLKDALTQFAQAIVNRNDAVLIDDATNNLFNALNPSKEVTNEQASQDPQGKLEPQAGTGEAASTNGTAIDPAAPAVGG